MNNQEIRHRFTYHAPHDQQIPMFQELRDGAHDLATALNRMTVDSREKSVAITKLEEFVMWANAAIVRNS